MAIQKVSKAFGEVLGELRGKTGLSQEELAKKSRLNRTFISFLERGLRQPTLVSMVKIASALNVRASQIVAKVEKRL